MSGDFENRKIKFSQVEGLKKVEEALRLAAELKGVNQLTSAKIAEISNGLAEGFREPFLKLIRSRGLTE